MENEDIIQAFENFISAQIKNDTYTLRKYKIKENLTRKVFLEIHVGGARGGNCWNNPPHTYKKNNEDIKLKITDNLVGSFKHLFDTIEHTKINLTNTAAEFSELIHKKEHNYHYEKEYYGNYTKNNLYLVEIEYFLIKTLDTETFDLFKTVLNNIKFIEDAIYIQNSLSERQKELTNSLSTFDADKAKEKSYIKQNLESYQKFFNEFDGQMEIIKSGLKKEFNQIQKKLNPSSKKLKK